MVKPRLGFITEEEDRALWNVAAHLANTFSSCVTLAGRDVLPDQVLEATVRALALHILAIRLVHECADPAHIEAVIAQIPAKYRERILAGALAAATPTKGESS